jgi:hypothetical protein
VHAANEDDIRGLRCDVRARPALSQTLLGLYAGMLAI